LACAAEAARRIVSSVTILRSRQNNVVSTISVDGIQIKGWVVQGKPDGKRAGVLDYDIKYRSDYDIKYHCAMERPRFFSRRVSSRSLRLNG
jgi:hypothetical protein